ncbi:MAG: hypothetical protein JW699_03135 [Chitinispirillaceae bacterium]|nr:hypothetical protein [Chitinispirillaceae bacterium]
MSSSPSLPKTPRIGADPFHDFHPVLWNPAGSDGNAVTACGIYSIKRNHGVNGIYKLHNPNDAINDDRPAGEKILLEYVINGRSHALYTVADLQGAPYPIDQASAGNIMGDIAERIARRVTKYFLKHWSRRGYTGGIFDRRFDPAHRDDFIVGSTNDYVLKIDRYPNLIILKRTGKGKFGYESIKELDGFFDYRFGGRRNILVLESKLEKINVGCDDLLTHLFLPLRQLFPDTRFHYVLFTDRNSIYVRHTYARWRQIKQLPVRLNERLGGDGIGTLFFTFNETREDFEKIKDFLILQHRAVSRKAVTLHGRTVISDKELLVFDGGETPHIKLIKDTSSGLWKEVKLRHKRVNTK